MHCDLKPENIIVGEDDCPVLCDFGLARRRGTARVTASGTLFSISPEELLGLEVGPSADLFALGALIHRLLVPARRSAREFYGSFPQSSFLDAAGTDPEELPSWARDLVVSLTARDPARRPRSTAEVGRMLADRLGLTLESSALVEELRWPASFGRDAWVAAWLRDAEESGQAQWLQTPPLEDAKPFWEHLRLFASLRGQTTLGLDLGVETADLDHGVALDAWAARTAQSTSPFIGVWVDALDARLRRALEALERATAYQRERGKGPRLFVVSPEASPSTFFQTLAIPAVDAGAARRFVERAFPSEGLERRHEFAERLTRASQGSATRADEVLVLLQERGAILFKDEAFRLRPGELLEALFEDGLETTRELTDLDERSIELFSSLCVLDGRASPQAVAALLRVDAGALGPQVARLRREGWIGLERRDGALVLVLRRQARLTPPAVRFCRSLHARRASELETGHESPARAAMHRFLADPCPSTAAGLCAALASLRELGRAESALEIADGLEALSSKLDIDLRRAVPELWIERARAWCSIGQTEFALRAVEALPAERTQALEAMVELVFAQIASLRNETDRALAHFERAASLDPAARVESAIGRVQLLHTLGRDAEVLAEVHALSPRELERRGELSFRKRLYVESRAFMSAHRMGDAQSALEKTRSLIEEARQTDDPNLEAALQINVAIMERGTGSLAAARASLARAIELYDRAGLVAGLAHARATLGGLLREFGELLEAEPLLVAALETRHRLSDLEGAWTARGMLGLLQFERGHARGAIETLEATAGAMSGAQRRRHAPLLAAKALEMRARIRDATKPWNAPSEAEETDPRILLARARAAWIGGDAQEADVLVRRAISLSASLKAPRLVHEAEVLAARLNGASRPSSSSPWNTGQPTTLLDLDEQVFHVLRADAFEADEARRLAEELERRGRDDRAARLWLGLAARISDRESARQARERAESLLALCTAGLTDAEAAAFRLHLLSEPDPWPGDFAPRSDALETEDEIEMEIITLLDINRQLVRQKDLDSLLGVIVEKALQVAGAERGFLVLEEHGELRFDTALDSRRGDIAEPELEISEGVVREALSQMKPVRVSNAVDDPLLGHRTSVVSLELRSILCVPFEINGDLRGAIYIDHRLRKNAFDERAEKLCTLLADQAALAIQQLRRLEEIRALNRELKRRVIEREADLRDARRALDAVRVRGSTGLVGNSSAIREVRELLAKLAPSDLAVLVTGPSGTGKELAARSLHELSLRRAKPFVSENCAALPPTLIESELFGYRRGAFTGADRDHVGLIEQANGGTLFLDEIGEVPLDLQAKLLRVLETGEVRRLGEHEARQVDFRLVAATNRDLEREVREGRFRSDLFYRLQGVRIEMPALASHTEDIPALIEHFLELEAGPGGAPRKISKRMLAALARRPWPGNVRELKNEVARLCVLMEDDLDDPSQISAPASTAEPLADPNGVLPIAELERRAIVNAIQQTGGDKSRAAELLGISRAKLYQRLKEWKDGDLQQ